MFVVAGHAQRVPRCHHAHHQAQHPRGVRTAVDQIAQEHGLPPVAASIDRPPLRVPHQVVTQFAQQDLEFGAAAVDVADHVERPGLVPPVAVQPGAGDRHVRDLLDPPQGVHRAEALPLQATQPAAELVTLPPDHLRPEIPVRAGRIAVQTHPLRHVEHDRDRQHVVLAGQRDELLARLRLHVGGVDDGQSAGGQPQARNVFEQLERQRSCRLVILVVGHQPAAEVAGNHLGRAKMGAAERRLARPADADQHHQAELRNGEFAWSRCAPW